MISTWIQPEISTQRRGGAEARKRRVFWSPGAAAFPRIRIPLAIFFGDEDPLASVQTTRSVYRSASSDYLLWRPVRGNSHLDLTMGYDIRQICYDVKNLMTYALDHEGAPTSLPRRRRAR